MLELTARSTRAAKVDALGDKRPLPCKYRAVRFLALSENS